jgi:transglutaminase-like putative cysteine protease
VKKTEKNIMITSTLILMLLLAGCGGVKTDNNFLLLSNVAVEDGETNIPLHALLSWKINGNRNGDTTYVIRLFSDMEEIESENIGTKDDYFYYQPEEPLSSDTQYNWQIEAYENGLLIGTTKTYSFRTQSTSKYEMRFICYNEENEYEPNIWMAVPKAWPGSKNTIQVDNVSFTPASATEYTDETGNRIVRWDTTQTPASSYTVKVSIEIVDKQYPNILCEDLIFDYNEDSENYIKHTQSSDFFQSDHPDIIAQAQAIIGEETNPFRIALLLNDWVVQNVTYGPGEKDALSVLQTRVTDCGGYASLNVAFCRALGIPARAVIGIHKGSFNTGLYEWSQDKEEFGTHCWYEVYFEKYGWIQFESTSFNGDPFNLDKRIILSKSPITVNGQQIHWFHIPHAGKLNDYEYQAERLPYKFLLEVQKQ